MTREVLGFVPGRPIRTVITGPVYHSVPNFYGLRAAREGALVILQPRFDAEGLLRLIEQYRITHLHTVPTMFVRTASNGFLSVSMGRPPLSLFHAMDVGIERLI